MKTVVPQDVLAFGQSARSRFEALGGARLALQAEHDRSLRDLAGQALADVGAWDVDPRSDDELLAAAELCRVAGALALPYPLVERLLAVDGALVALVDPRHPRIDHGDLAGPWLAVDLDGRAFQVETGAPTGSRLGPFVVPGVLGLPRPDVPADDVARHLVLGAWRILGGLETALAQASAHVKAREQFGQPLAQFQAVRFAVADAVVAVRGLTELAKFTVWRLGSAAPAARQADAVMLRLHAVDVARGVLRTSHQLMGALGFCDEHDISVLDRHLQPLLRLPCAAEALAARLVPAVESGALESLFSR
ncbi:MAG: acyl-CoA dehydrogenase [Frankiales bacterium]|nr:acyl-CoA dehydrogenase [Frankiales bacterium]